MLSQGQHPPRFGIVPHHCDGWARRDPPFLLGNTMKDIENFIRMATPLLQELGYDLVRAKMYQSHGTAVLQVMIERHDSQPVQHPDCHRVTYALLDMIEAEDPVGGAYNLEVSSVGAERPLIKVSDYERFKGHKARLVLRLKQDGHRQFTGRLGGIDGQTILLTVDHGPSHVPTSVAVDFSAIKEAHLLYDEDLAGSSLTPTEETPIAEDTITDDDPNETQE